MEKKRLANDLSEDQFSLLLSKARNGDKSSVQKLLLVFEEEIKSLAKYILMPEQDAIQTITLNFIESIHNYKKEEE